MNLLTTIPKSKFKTWAIGERVCRKCDGETIHSDGGPWFWLINTQRMPSKPVVGSVCFMIYDGRVRGYFDIIEINNAELWHDDRTGYSIVMANWHPIYNGEEYPGFQGWRYTHLNPVNV